MLPGPFTKPPSCRLIECAIVGRPKNTQLTDPVAIRGHTSRSPFLFPHRGVQRTVFAKLDGDLPYRSDQTFSYARETAAKIYFAVGCGSAATKIEGLLPLLRKQFVKLEYVPSNVGTDHALAARVERRTFSDLYPHLVSSTKQSPERVSQRALNSEGGVFLVATQSTEAARQGGREAVLAFGGFAIYVRHHHALRIGVGSGVPATAPGQCSRTVSRHRRVHSRQSWTRFKGGARPYRRLSAFQSSLSRATAGWSCITSSE